jgi:hypothetical protein
MASKAKEIYPWEKIKSKSIGSRTMKYHTDSVNVFIEPRYAGPLFTKKTACELYFGGFLCPLPYMTSENRAPPKINPRQK